MEKGSITLIEIEIYKFERERGERERID